ncbi:hypothetical protein EsVE80_23380 [Enterococcus saigonensis]|uniref:Beta-galactosidase trimerisation domain-containing protein n=1 Tax=Enterococcus saigonensis TaxID=1805431 RepID=A0A679IMM7_9ENTE|nr:beta-galactosidase trimerization domain-containing protein [Enterococcus saigonensis]BCA86815.1 hypothetical protein EsVE80_23380 [Enterococcus saigonensis]
MNKLPYRQVHLDFHTPKLPFTLGKSFNKEVFQKTLKDAHINSVTLTGRCHHGHIYYDTKLPARHPQMQGDFLMEQVDACHEIGIKSPIYVTVGWDSFSADKHPEWLERKPDNSIYGFQNYGQMEPGWKTLCFNTPYLDYLKEQIKDMMLHFISKLDGLFFDIVWQDTCCCNYCIDKMIKIGLNPESEDDRVIFAKQTEQFLKDEIYTTVQEIDKTCPIFFNEGNILPSIRSNLNEYSHLEIESLPSGEWGYQHFPTVVRYAKNLGKEYVGMTGKFHKVWADFGSYKNLAALEYETFLALAHGAKCSIGDQMYPDGTLQSATYELIGKVYNQVEQLEGYNDNSVALTEVAIVHPGVTTDSASKVDISLAGAVNILNEGQYQFDIVDLEMDWNHYKVIILPDKITLTNKIEKKIKDYLENNVGKILATYESGLNERNIFLPEWGINYVGENSFKPTYGCYGLFFNDLPKGELVLHGSGILVEPIEAEVLGKEKQPMYQRNYQHYYSHFQAPVSKFTGHPVVTRSNRVMYFTHPLFEMYKVHGVLQYKQLILSALNALLEGPIITTSLPSTGDVILNHNYEQKKLILNLLHYLPQRKAVELDTIEEVIPIHNVKVCISLDKALSKSIEINSVTDVRKHQELDYGIEDNKLEFTVPIVNGYQIIVIQYK